MSTSAKAKTPTTPSTSSGTRTSPTKAKPRKKIRIIPPTLHPLQLRISQSKARFLVVVCGRRWGKTRLGARKALEYACQKKRVWWIAPTIAQARIAWRLVKPRAKKIPGVVVRESERVIFFPGGGEIWCKSSDRPDNLRGEGLDFAIMDEADYQDEGVWKQVIRPALADRRGGALFISTPRQEGGWFHRMYQRGQQAEGRAAGWRSWHYPSETNPYLDPQELKEASEDLPEIEYRREFGAEFVATPDAVYSTFSRQIHVRPCPLDTSKKLWIGADFNNSDNNPMTGAVLQFDGQIFRVLAEIVTHGTTEEQATNIRAWLLAQKISTNDKRVFLPSVVEVIPDASGKASSHSGVSDHEFLRRAGLPLNPPSANPPIRDRDNAVLARLKNAKGDIRLFFDVSCRQTIESFARLTHRGRDRSPWSHLCDCVGYVIHRLAPIQTTARFTGHGREQQKRLPGLRM